jgi:hypothetical protein
MYLIELRPGHEEVYGSVADLAAAIRRGEVGPQSRIYHRATAKWISVTLHPEFKKFAAERRSTPRPPMPRQGTFLQVKQANREPASEDPSAEASAAPVPTSQKNATSPGWRRALGLAFRKFGKPPLT